MKSREEKAAYYRIYNATHLEERATWRKAHREEMLIYNRAHYAAHPEENAIYRAARRDKMAAWRKVHHERTAIYSRIWRKVHPQEKLEETRRRRALKRGATIGPIDLEAIKARDRMLCAICSKKVADKDLSFDHSIPVSLGGAHSQENLRVAHLRCNIKRGAGRLPVQMVLV